MGFTPLPFAILAALVLGAFARLNASTTQADDLADLCQNAERICEVEVLAKDFVRLADGAIETRYTFATLLPLKGSMGATQEVRLPGGAIAGRGLAIPGMPNFEVGERHILFLSAADAKQWRMPVGLNAGAFQVRTASTAKQTQVVGAASCCDETAHREHVESYDQFVQRIFDELRR
ncbi:MAG: hypothetical protein H8E15_03060 [Planctomycetes bacterium]|nr:hypothetical protein [Planctomycetota bacterium]